MSDIAIKFENISKQYRLGLVSTRTLSHDLNRWWQTNVLRKEDPYLKIGESNDRTKKGESDYVWALRDIDFDVKKGEVLGIIGKNGAGKSTLLKILSRVTTPTTGLIKAQGRIASLLEVGTGFHPELTGRENIYMNGSIMGMTRQEITKKLDEIVEFAGVARYIDTPVKRYSSGMTVRLGFSIAAHLEPEILVVDEVLAVGDADFQKKALGKMQDVSRGEGRTVLFVSHNMSAVRSLCNTGIVLVDGQLSYSGNIEDCISKYINEYKADQGKIIDAISFCKKNIRIDNITINASSGKEFQLNSSEINVCIDGELMNEQFLAMEIKLLDQNSNVVGFFSPGHLYGEINEFPKGKFSISETFHLPENLSKGMFFLDICLTYPNIEYLMTAPMCAVLYSPGVLTQTGFEFDYKFSGALVLK